MKPRFDIFSGPARMWAVAYSFICHCEYSWQSSIYFLMDPRRVLGDDRTEH